MIHSKTTKDKARELRKDGKSYKEIWDVMKIPKSTLSTWFGEELGVAAYSQKWLEHLARIRPLANKMKTKIRLDGLEKVKVDMEKEVV